MHEDIVERADVALHWYPTCLSRRHHLTHNLACGRSDVSHDQEDWLAYTRVDWGYGRVTVHDGYSLTFEFVLSKVRAVHSFCRTRWLPLVSFTNAVVYSYARCALQRYYEHCC